MCAISSLKIWIELKTCYAVYFLTLPQARKVDLYYYPYEFGPMDTANICLSVKFFYDYFLT